jgi:cellobiose phosphorylase
MYRIAVEWLLGLRLRGNSLSLHPCVPSSWPTYSIRLVRAKTTYEIRVDPGRDLRATLDGVALEGTTIAIVDDGRVHKVLVAGATSRQMAV